MKEWSEFKFECSAFVFEWFQFDILEENASGCMYRIYPGVDEGFRSSETRPKPEKTRDITELRLLTLGQQIISSHFKYIIILNPNFN